MQQVYKQHEREVFGDQEEQKEEPVAVETKENVHSEVKANLKLTAASEIALAPAAAV